MNRLVVSVHRTGEEDAPAAEIAIRETKFTVAIGAVVRNGGVLHHKRAALTEVDAATKSAGRIARDGGIAHFQECRWVKPDRPAAPARFDTNAIRSSVTIPLVQTAP